MRRLRCFTLALAASSVLSTGVASAADVRYDLGFYTAYVWRGQSVTDGPSFQPAVTVSHKSGFSLNVWGSMDLDNTNDIAGDFVEVDITPSYGFEVGIATLEVGLIEYLFPEFGGGTREVYVSSGFDVLLSPSISLYYDLDEVEDFYAKVAIEYGRDINNDWSWSVAADAGYSGSDFAAFYSGGTESGWYDGNLSLTVTWAPRDSMSLGALIAYSGSLDDDVLIPEPDGSPVAAFDGAWGGVSLSMSF